jgi:hypothetical protein
LVARKDSALWKSEMLTSEHLTLQVMAVLERILPTIVSNARSLLDRRPIFFDTPKSNNISLMRVSAVAASLGWMSSIDTLKSTTQILLNTPAGIATATGVQKDSDAKIISCNTFAIITIMK